MFSIYLFNEDNRVLYRDCLDYLKNSLVKKNNYDKTSKMLLTTKLT